MGELVDFPGGGPPPGDEPATGFPEADPNVIATLEAALNQARCGDLRAFIMVCEFSDGSTDPLWDTMGSRNIKLLLAELVLETTRLSQYLAAQAGVLTAPEGS